MAVLVESRDDEQTFGRDTSHTCDHIRCDGANTDVDASGSGVNETCGDGDLVADDTGPQNGSMRRTTSGR